MFRGFLAQAGSTVNIQCLNRSQKVIFWFELSSSKLEVKVVVFFKETCQISSIKHRKNIKICKCVTVSLLPLTVQEFLIFDLRFSYSNCLKFTLQSAFLSALY